MRSTSVVPVRGMPTMKIGLARGATAAGAAGERRRQPLGRREQRLIRGEAVAESRRLAALTTLEEPERVPVPLLVLALLRERVADVQLGVRIERRLLERPFERRDLGRRERRACDLRKRRPGALKASDRAAALPGTRLPPL